VVGEFKSLSQVFFDPLVEVQGTPLAPTTHHLSVPIPCASCLLSIFRARLCSGRDPSPGFQPNPVSTSGDFPRFPSCLLFNNYPNRFSPPFGMRGGLFFAHPPVSRSHVPILPFRVTPLSPPNRCSHRVPRPSLKSTSSCALIPKHDPPSPFSNEPRGLKLSCDRSRFSTFAHFHGVLRVAEDPNPH